MYYIKYNSATETWSLMKQIFTPTGYNEYPVYTSSIKQEVIDKLKLIRKEN